MVDPRWRRGYALLAQRGFSFDLQTPWWHLGEAADLAAADTWIGGSPNRVDSETDPGTNAVIARTRAGEESLAAAAACRR